MIMSAAPADLDLVIFGATGFTGQLCVSYVDAAYGKTIKWGVAGRSRAKLEQVVATRCTSGKSSPAILVADANDEAAIERLVASTRVVISTAGPYSRYGTTLVKTVVQQGKGYCDITGEIPWVRSMVERFDAQARQTGARVVHLCGHDSVPWDLSTLMLAEKLKADSNGEEQLARVEFWNRVRGSVSGGTIETAMALATGSGNQSGAVKEPTATPIGFDPLLLLPASDGKDAGPVASEFKTKLNNVRFVDFGRLSGQSEKMPVRSMFVMAGVNGSAVKRSNALNGYGPCVVYREGSAHKNVAGAILMASAQYLFGLLVIFPPTRWLLRKYVLPKPGEGPSEEEMKRGFLVLDATAIGTRGSVLKSRMRFPTDPGYKDTARMLVESGLALALDADKIESRGRGGVLTPAVCQGKVLLDRLIKTGSSFEFIGQ
ncbi:putative trans-acting enoyl reductase [Porphyridium purpureum]|uniref:Putative trans-acting enoyl reductase n=1 Tax=Porphyridium purpureum TaxID=35688 RepID=A0A5J4YNX1_PORPP|nr:putative trans-acting enoyl reductase [Porphyridium purpureum]|eukprot:POR9053..scf295_9